MSRVLLPLSKNANLILKGHNLHANFERQKGEGHTSTGKKERQIEKEERERERERQRNTLINEFWCFKKYCWIGSYEI